MKRLTAHIAHRVADATASPDRVPVYEYALGTLLNLAIIFGATFTVAWLLGRTQVALVWYAMFLPVRCSAGGAHTNTPQTCLLVSILACIGAVLLNPLLLGVPVLLPALITGSAFSIAAAFCCAPVLHENHPLAPERVRPVRIVSRVVVLAECALLSGMYAADARQTVAAGLLGLLAATISTVVGWCAQRVSKDPQKRVHLFGR